MTKRGRCLCGSTRWEFQGEAAWACYCHCDDCRRNCAAPLVAWLGVPIRNFKWLAAAPKTLESSKGVRRHFCASCGSPMGFEADHYPGGSKLPWLQIADDLPKYAGTLLETPEDPRGYKAE